MGRHVPVSVALRHGAWPAPPADRESARSRDWPSTHPRREGPRSERTAPRAASSHRALAATPVHVCPSDDQRVTQCRSPINRGGRQALPLRPGPARRGIDKTPNPEIPRSRIELWDVSLVENRPASGNHLPRRNAMRQAGGNGRAANPADCSCFQCHSHLEMPSVPAREQRRFRDGSIGTGPPRGRPASILAVSAAGCQSSVDAGDIVNVESVGREPAVPASSRASDIPIPPPRAAQVPADSLVSVAVQEDGIGRTCLRTLWLANATTIRFWKSIGRPPATTSAAPTGDWHGSTTRI